MEKKIKSPCEKCKDRVCEKEGSPCKEVENILQGDGIRRRGWIGKRFGKNNKSYFNKYGVYGSQRREIPFSSMGGTWRQKYLDENMDAIDWRAK
jgi:hypothetical protein